MSMVINCPNCGIEIDMHDVQDVYRDDDQIELDCERCHSVLIAEPTVKITFAVSVESRITYKPDEVTNGKD